MWTRLDQAMGDLIWRTGGLVCGEEDYKRRPVPQQRQSELRLVLAHISVLLFIVCIYCRSPI